MLGRLSDNETQGRLSVCVIKSEEYLHVRAVFPFLLWYIFPWPLLHIQAPSFTEVQLAYAISIHYLRINLDSRTSYKSSV